MAALRRDVLVAAQQVEGFDLECGRRRHGVGHVLVDPISDHTPSTTNSLVWSKGGGVSHTRQPCSSTWPRVAMHAHCTNDRLPWAGTTMSTCTPRMAAETSVATWGANGSPAGANPKPAVGPTPTSAQAVDALVSLLVT